MQLWQYRLLVTAR